LAAPPTRGDPELIADEGGALTIVPRPLSVGLDSGGLVHHRCPAGHRHHHDFRRPELPGTAMPLAAMVPAPQDRPSQGAHERAWRCPPRVQEHHHRREEDPLHLQPQRLLPSRSRRPAPPDRVGAAPAAYSGTITTAAVVLSAVVRRPSHQSPEERHPPCIPAGDPGPGPVGGTHGCPTTWEDAKASPPPAPTGLRPAAPFGSGEGGGGGGGGPDGGGS
jgi:hypothetical protein